MADDDTPEVVRLASEADQLIRAINHATICGTGGITYPSELEQTVRSLAGLAHKLPQAIQQLARIGSAMKTAALYDDRLPDSQTAAEGTIEWALAELDDSQPHAGQLGNALNRAAEQFNHLGVRDG